MEFFCEEKIIFLPQVGDGADERRAIAAKGSKAHELRSFNYSHDFNDYEGDFSHVKMRW